LAAAKTVAGYFLRHLPDDRICYWDLCFTSGSEPRDSSAAAIAACGLLELAEWLPEEDPDRRLYEKAARGIVNELTTNYLARRAGSNGVLEHAVYHMPKRIGVDESCIWGDYFYFEALVRLGGRWTPYW
jgi:unsaturated chondroitin disaccharide hydrolase